MARCWSGALALLFALVSVASAFHGHSHAGIADASFIAGEMAVDEAPSVFGMPNDTDHRLDTGDCPVCVFNGQVFLPQANLALSPLSSRCSVYRLSWFDPPGAMAQANLFRPPIVLLA